ncbi:hypothetical protein A3D77_05855 [Candidatus Gottesmanbacteria bacterium RIFCSPHIGHO2_02_FULL_39_11]|uniref:AbiEi antitoxin N-terminal domain-containing protein n=1 Tax=Candidatus Gottesmanbacteria bacterium RIFCSPHIGHO2_02_FULL_39_11 TaxID=1798382 RepID=A0A1F5ZSX0_9BACT|nr:MAG: hypothetical protein A3D77_05855 [Candidatus Gottesmanbacteria bacterium RIFCSPHIGHO2_02_FULL_39_11]
MAAKKLTVMEFIRKLQALDRGFFTTADLEKITGLERNSLKVSLNRMVKKEILTRLKRGVYQLSLNMIDVKKVANQLYYPSYLSFETALSQYGILSQIPYTQTFATLNKSKKMTIWNTEVEFTQLKKDLYFGYQFENGIYIAKPEKALLDDLYLVSRGKRTLNIEELDLRNISKNVLEEFAQKYPAYMGKLLSEVMKYIGTTPITNENKERIIWDK